MIQQSRQKVDSLIIGGGLAGIHLALHMVRNGFNPLVIDQPDPTSSSRIAAGIINPITGRRFAMTWLYNDLEPVFTEVYRYWENKWGSHFFRPVNIYRSVPDNKLVNDLDAKLSNPDYQKYCRPMEEREVQRLSSTLHLKTPGYVMNGYQVNTGHFLDRAISYLTAMGMYLKGEYSYTGKDLKTEKFTFQNYFSENLVWANGAAIVDQPLFSWVKMNPNKGEILYLRTEDQHPADIIKQSAFFIPMNQNLIWLGSYNTWDFEDSGPTTQGLEYLKSKARLLQQPYQIKAHLSAIRPAVEDRRPVLGAHPEHKNIYLFNGFGSKGTSLIPYFAKNMVDHLFHGARIHSEVSIHRYWF